MLNNNSLYYGTPANEWQKHYQNKIGPFVNGRNIYTQLPRTATLIHTVAILIFTGLAVLKFGAPLAILGVSATALTVYNNIIRKDPLITAFEQIIGWSNFNNLPNLPLVPQIGENIGDTINKLNWKTLDKPLYRSQTPDGRTIVIVKGLSRTNPYEGTRFVKEVYPHRQRVFAFVERLAPEDLPPSSLPMNSRIRSIFTVIFGHFLAPFFGGSFTGNRFGQITYSAALGHPATNVQISMDSVIWGELANELAVQQ